MKFIEVKDEKDINWAKTWALYEESFPEHERRRKKEHLLAMKDDKFCCCSIWDKDLFVGILFYWNFDKYSYIDHFAIEKSLQGKSYGTKAIEKLCRQSDTVVLEIEPPSDEKRKRRLGFYERLGFKVNPYDYELPSFRKDCEPYKLWLLSSPKVLNEKEYDKFWNFIKERTLVYSQE